MLWDFKDTPFKSVYATEKVDYHVIDSPCIEEATERIKQILDTKYEKADVNEVAKQCTHLTRVSEELHVVFSEEKLQGITLRNKNQEIPSELPSVIEKLQRYLVSNIP